MPLYQYDSFNRRGKKITGTIDAASKQDAITILRGQGLMPTNIEETSAAKLEGPFWKRFFQKKVDIRTKVLFTKQLGVLLKSGVPLLQAIELLTEQFEGVFKRVLIHIKDGIKAGESIASEMKKYPKIFPNVYVQLVRAGEASGKLEVILNRLTTYLERTEETRKKIRKALAYPIAMLSFAVLVVVGVLTFLVPRIKDMFAQMGQELPGPTQLLIGMSDILMNNLVLISILFLGIVIAFTRWKKTTRGQYKFDEIILRLPLVSYFSKTKAVVQFSKTLGMLLESGVNLAEALDIVCNIIDNEVLTQKLLEARDSIIKEGKIAKYLKKTNMFPAIASYMISTGEESGQLAQMLLTVGNDYDTELTEITESMTSKITPIMTIVMGLIVLFIILAIFLPIMQMSEGMGI
ncbi:type II secretion system F family protein [Candidatus Dependentiae bacterium]|nr:type II secretion system F family protein [Candidatus Dependentiae bacterium]